MKVDKTISYKVTPDIYRELMRLSDDDKSVHLVARELMELSLRNGTPIVKDVSPELARVAWFIVSALHPELSSDEVLELVRNKLLVPSDKAKVKG